MPTDSNKHLAHKTLLEFGLSEKEAKIYLALLELEIAGVQDISKKTGVNRSSTYVVIESLKKRGLVSMSPDKKVQEYIAATPEILLEIAKDASERAAATKEKIREILPELRGLQKETVHKPKVIVYEGDEALKLSYYSTFDSSEFRIYKDLSGMRDVVPQDYIEQDAKKRRSNKVQMRLIAPDTTENEEIVHEYAAHKSPDECLLIPPKKFSKTDNNIGIGIYKDRVKFASGKDKFSIFIINQAITDTLRDLFDLAWEESKRLNTHRNKGKVSTQKERRSKQR
jgi:sugar-specific transcriptional regulator TrmB